MLAPPRAIPRAMSVQYDIMIHQVCYDAFFFFFFLFLFFFFSFLKLRFLA